MSKKKMLICGGGGFIAQNAIEYFRKLDYDITATVFVDEPKIKYNDVKYINADLCDRNYVRRVLEGQEIVVQAAAVTTGAKDVIERPYLHVTDNAIMNSLLLREAYEQNTVRQFIFFSCTVMLESKETKQKESEWNPGKEIYSAHFGVGNTKVYLEKMLEFYTRLGRFKGTAIRHSNVYGPYDKFDLERSHIIGATVNKVLNAKDEIEVWGTGRAARDVLYVDDLIDFVDKAINNQQSPYEIFHCGGGYAMSIIHIVQTIMKVANKTLKIKFDESKPDIPTFICLDCSKAKELLGWEVKTSFEEGIKKTIEWVKANTDILTKISI